MKRFSHSQAVGAGGGQPPRGFVPGMQVGMERMGGPPHMMGGQVPFATPGSLQVGSMMDMTASMGPSDAAAAQKGFDPRAMVGAMGPLDAAEYFAGHLGAGGDMGHHQGSHQMMHGQAPHRGGVGMGGAGMGGAVDMPAKVAAQSAGLNGGGSKRQRTGAGPAGQGLPGMQMEGVHQDALMELARENLLLKHQLHVATLEMSRLSSVLNGFQAQAPQDEPKAKQKQAQSRYWTEQEHQRFLEAVQNFGHKDVKAIANIVGTRSATQVRTHAQKYFMKMARFKKSDDNGKGGSRNTNTNPDAAPSEAAEDDNCTGTAAAAAAAAGEAGTSAAAAAAFVAASHSKTGAVQGKSSGKAAPPLENAASGKAPTAQQNQPVRVSSKKNPGSPGSMDSGRSVGSSDGTSNGRSNGTTSNDNTNGNGSSSSNNSNRNGNEGSCSDSGRGDSNNGVSSNEGSDHGFFDTGAEEEAFVDDLQFQNGDDNAKTGFEFAETEAETAAT